MNPRILLLVERRRIDSLTPIVLMDTTARAHIEQSLLLYFESNTNETWNYLQTWRLGNIYDRYLSAPSTVAADLRGLLWAAFCVAAYARFLCGICSDGTFSLVALDEYEPRDDVAYFRKAREEILALEQPSLPALGEFKIILYRSVIIEDLSSQRGTESTRGI